MGEYLSKPDFTGQLSASSAQLTPIGSNHPPSKTEHHGNFVKHRFNAAKTSMIAVQHKFPVIKVD
jgi:hypothetical protein